MTDPIDQAINATEVEERVNLPVQIASTGRVAVLNLPYDLTESELAELCGFLLTQVLSTARVIAQERARARIEIARVMP